MVLLGHSGPRLLIHFRNHFSQTVGLLGRVISSSQGRCLNTGQHKHRINAHTTPNTHALNGIRTHDPRVRASEDSSCLRPRGHCDRPTMVYNTQNYWVFGLWPSSIIPETRKHNFSETGSVSVLRWRGEDNYSVGSLRKNEPQSQNQ
jgi:hypothetical protein